MPPKCGKVELTKIHYFNANNSQIPSISREIYDNQLNSNIVKTNNIFGHRWTLKINELATNETKNSHKRCQIGALFLLIASITFALYFTYFTKNSNPAPILIENPPFLINVSNKTHEKISDKPLRTFCNQCEQHPNYICLKTNEISAPKCVRVKDKRDPTGCGGFCALNDQFCQLLDHFNRVYQCQNLRNRLQCPKNAFNCGNRCIKHAQKCDGIVDCANKTDEIDCVCSLETHFRCEKSLECVEKRRKCDGIIDCLDKTDETNCQNAKSCEKGRRPCQSGDCIPKEQFCDGFHQCKDKSDEPKGCQLVLK